MQIQRKLHKYTFFCDYWLAGNSNTKICMFFCLVFVWLQRNKVFTIFIKWTFETNKNRLQNIENQLSPRRHKSIVKWWAGGEGSRGTKRHGANVQKFFSFFSFSIFFFSSFFYCQSYLSFFSFFLVVFSDLTLLTHFNGHFRVRFLLYAFLLFFSS